MKIVDKQYERHLRSSTLWLLVAAGALILGIFLGNAGTINRFYGEALSISNRIATARASADLPLLTVNIDFEAYNQLLSQREDALANGVLFPRDSAPVAAEIIEDGRSVPIWIRLLPGMANHLGAGDKWNFQVVTRDDALISGLTAANLINPQDNGWLKEWAFLQSMRREGLQAGDYQFVRLVFNGDDRGIYALQEFPGTLIESDTGAPPAVLVSYDSTPLLETISYFGDLESAVADPISNIAATDPRFLQIAEIQDPAVTEDEMLSRQADRATALLRGLQSGDLEPSQVFDVEKYGRFLALADLWGANNALSPLNLHYIYNSESDRLEPVAFNGDVLHDDARLPLEALYQDRQIQEAYAASASRFSDPDYLAELRADLENEYAALSAAQDAEIDPASVWDELAARQALLRLSLQPTQPVIAQLGSPALAQEAIIRVQIANPLNLPLEILGFDIDGATFLEPDASWITGGESHVQVEDKGILLQPLDESQGLRFVTFDLPLVEIIKQDSELDFLNEIQIQVATRVLGLEETQLTPASPGLLETP